MSSGGANFSSGGAYEMYMGRWSRLVAPVLLGWLSVPSGGRWLEVGSGTGELTRAILSGCDPASVLGVDPSAGLVESARDVIRDDRVRLEVGGAEVRRVSTLWYRGWC